MGNTRYARVKQMYGVEVRLNDCLAERKYPNSPIVALASISLDICIGSYTHAYA
jgi:hypothetical protein